MAIFGSVTLEDISINFTIDKENVCHYILYDHVSREIEHCQAPGHVFMNALATVVHWEGAPNCDKDYPEA